MTVQERLRPGKYRLTVEDYLRLDEAGAFGGHKTELIEGDVFVVSPQFLPHGFVKTELYDQLRDALRALGSPWRVMSEVSLDLSPDSMPAPDILVTSEPRGSGAASKEAVKLLIEVSDTTLREDLAPKRLLYARHGIPEYWVADVNGRIVHQMWSPTPKVYDKEGQVAFGEPLTSRTIDHLAIGSQDL